MFKRQQNESTYGKSVTVTEMFFHKMDPCWRDFVKPAIANCMKNEQAV